MEVIVDGLDELARDLLSSAVQVGPRAGETIGDVADDILDSAQAFAPVLTGTLRASGRVDRSGLVAEVYFTAEHAGYVEEGTSDTAPQPYLGPAADLHTPAIDGALGDMIDRLPL